MLTKSQNKNKQTSIETTAPKVCIKVVCDLIDGTLKVQANMLPNIYLKNDRIRMIKAKMFNDQVVQGYRQANLMYML